MDGDLRTRAANVARLLARTHKAVAVAVPESWTDTDGTDDVAMSHRARAFLLGLSPDSIGDMQLMALSKQLARKLPRALAIAIRRLLLARGPIPRSVVPKLTGLRDAELDLVMTCVAYGDAAVRVPDQTRAVLLEQFHGVPRPRSPLAIFTERSSLERRPGQKRSPARRLPSSRSMQCGVSRSIVQHRSSPPGAAIVRSP